MSTHSPAHASTTPAGPAPVRNAVGTAPTGPAPRPARSRIQGRQTLLRSVHAEWIKFWSLRSTWITSFITIALTVLFGAGLTAVLGRTEEYQDTAKNLITHGLSIRADRGRGPGSPHHHRGVLLRTDPLLPGRRPQARAAPGVQGSGPGHRLLPPGVVSVFLSWAISKPFIGEHAGSLTDSHYVGYIWGSGLVFAVIALMALGLGFLLRSTAGTITVIVSLLFVITAPLQLAASKWPWVYKIIGCLPSTVSEAVSDPFQRTTEWGGQGAQFLTHGQAIAVFAAWALIPLITAWFVFSRRDA